jgi:hypothetical protein
MIKEQVQIQIFVIVYIFTDPLIFEYLLDYVVLILFNLYMLFILYAHYFFDKKQKIVKVDKEEQMRVRNRIRLYEQLEILSMINTNKK